MSSERRTGGGWCDSVIGMAPYMMAFTMMASAGCEPIDQATGGGGGICFQDLRPNAMAINLTPSFEDFLFGGTTPAPTNGDFHQSNHAFAIEWDYVYEGLFTPGPAKHAYVTLVQILKNGDVVWETTVDSEPVDDGDEGSDSVMVWDGLPVGVYEVRVELDPDGDVPECDDLVSVVNNTMTMTIVVHGPNGPPQSPTPCQESEDPNCDDDEGPQGR